MFFSRYRAAMFLVAACLTAAASSHPAAEQTRTPDQKPQRHVPTGSISGVVRSSGPNRAPLSRARVILVSEAIAEPRVAITGANGTYSFEKLPAGGYVVQATASGYAAQYHRQRANASAPRVPLAEGQRLTAIDVELPPAGVLAGKILDEDNRPFVGASVDALASRMANGQPTLVSLANTITDDRGEFRLAGLPEGQYYVSAFDPAFAGVGDETGPLRYTATYYPGVVFVEEAKRVGVTPGVEPATEIVFALKIIRPARVSGIIATPDARQLITGAVIMSPIHGETLAPVPSDDVRISPDGTFAFRNVPPGRYQIRARAETDPTAVSLFATYRLIVNGRDIENVDLALLPGALVEGTVSYEARPTEKPLTFSQLRVRAPFADGSSFGDAPTGDVDDEGRYRIRGLMPGSHAIAVEGLEDPWVLKQVLWRGQDIIDVAFDVDTRDELSDVRIVITDVANDVRGVVRDGRGQPVRDALVLIVPLAAQFWRPTSRRFARLRTDADGRYRVRGLPAGHYRAIASIELDETEIFRKDVLHELVDQGQPLILDEPRTHVADLGLTSLARLSRTSGN